MTSGMSNARRRLLALANVPKYRDGGPVRGPGTGTSDDVLDRVRPGTFIMPADSVRQIGHDTLAKAGERVPVRLSNGEHKLSPDQVYAIGLQTLHQLKDATHTPVADRRPASRQSARERLLRLADGGMVSDVTRVGNSYSGGNVGGNITVNGQAPGGTVSQVSAGASAQAPAPAAAAASAAAPAANPAAGAATPGATAGTPATAAPAAPMGWAERNAQRSLEVTASSILPSKERDAAQSRLETMNQPAAPAAPAAPGAPAVPAAAALPGAAPAVASAAAGLGVPGAVAKAPTTPAVPARAPYTGTSLPARTGFADGGVVDPRQRRGGLQGVAERLAQIPTGGYPKAPAADGSQDRWSNTETGRNLSNIAAALPGSVGSALPAVARTGGAISTGIDQATRLLSGLAAGGGLSAAVVPTAGAATPSPAGAGAGAGRGSVNPPMVDPSAPLPTQSPASGMTPPPAADSTSDGATPNSQAAQPRVSSARDRLIAIASQVPADDAGIQAQPIRHSGNDWQARKNLENAHTAASSITNTRRWGGRGAENSPDMLEYRAALANDNALQQAEPALQQEGMRQRGLSARERLIQLAENMRASVGAERFDEANRIAAGELGLKQNAAGFQNRAAQRLENAQVAYERASTPAQRISARDRLLALAGKAHEDQWKAVALQGGMDAMGNKTESILGAVNERTGEMRRMENSARAPARTPPPDAVEMLRGNPALAARFDEFYGAGAARQAMGS